MDSTFIPVTITFVIFIILAYYLSVIRISIPLLMIYLIYCFSYFINNDDDDDIMQEKIVDNLHEKMIDNNINKLTVKNEGSREELVNRKDDLAEPKPIVSFSPKPIVIDSILNPKNNTDTSINKPKSLAQTLNKKRINDDEIFKPTLNLNEIMICRGIYKRNPIKPGVKFINNVDSLFCYTKISNSGSKQEVKHIWYFENKEMTTVSYNIKTSYNYRSWSKKTIYPNQTGNWRVDVVSKIGDLLGSREFTINSINTTY